MTLITLLLLACTPNDGTPPEERFELDVDAMSFSTPVDRCTSQDLLARNPGDVSMDVVVHRPVSTCSESPFLVSPAGVELPPGSTVPLTVEHCPTSSESCNATLVVGFEGEASRGQLEVVLLGASSCPDADGDGWQDCGDLPASDCDDADPSVHPTAEELPDGQDNDCDGQADEGTELVDDDGDGFSEQQGDCDDARPSVFPGAEEICDGLDNDCDTLVDDGVGLTAFADVDGDGFGNPAHASLYCGENPPEGWVTSSSDCNDASATTYPGAPELCDDEDNDCDGQVDDNATGDPSWTRWYADGDSDGQGNPQLALEACQMPIGYVENADDCDDGNADVRLGGPEVCDNLDNDCNGQVDEGAWDAPSWYADADGDGYGSLYNAVASCSMPTGYVATATDCDDQDSSVNPAAVEVCDGVDQDCDGTVDDNATDALTWYRDNDGDSYGLATNTTQSCTTPSGYASQAGDCDDGDSSSHPGAPEWCDTADNDCDSAVDEGAADAVEYYYDTDGDGYGDPQNSLFSCMRPTGAVENYQDCDDADSTSYPGATETCDGEDNDCDGNGDVGASDCPTACSIHYNPDSNHSYLFCHGVTASAMTAACDAAGPGGAYRVARIDDADEDSWLWSKYVSEATDSDSRGFFVDGVKQSDETWIWQDDWDPNAGPEDYLFWDESGGSSSSNYSPYGLYVSWGAGEPNNDDGPEIYVRVEDENLWNDENDQEDYYFCESR